MINRSACAAMALLLALPACAIPLGQSGGQSGSQSGGPGNPSAEAVAACGQRADEVYLRQNRDTLYKADVYASSIRDSPYGGQGQSSGTNALSDQFERNREMRICLNGANTPIQPNQAGPGAAP